MFSILFSIFFMSFPNHNCNPKPWFLVGTYWQASSPSSCWRRSETCSKSILQTQGHWQRGIQEYSQKGSSTGLSQRPIYEFALILYYVAIPKILGTVRFGLIPCFSQMPVWLCQIMPISSPKQGAKKNNFQGSKFIFGFGSTGALVWPGVNF